MQHTQCCGLYLLCTQHNAVQKVLKTKKVRRERGRRTIKYVLRRVELFDTALVHKGEPIAYGNDAVPRFGPPPFEACVVEVGDRPVETALTLRFD